MSISKKSWFNLWFDTKYYHILYDYRDNNEARFLIKKIIEHLQVTKDYTFLDIPCGMGRHSIYLNELGYDVTGCDLSKNSIKHAKKEQKGNLHFLEQDMRLPLLKKYNVILNLFTSFGYFDQKTNLQVLKNFRKSLLPKGVLVLDYMNTDKVKENLIYEEKIEKRGINFNIKRYIDKNMFICKEININDSGKKIKYFEKVKCYSFEELKILFKKAGLIINEHFGSYKLEPFDVDKSDRLIIIAS